MRMDGRRQSGNVEDRRGLSPQAKVGGGLGIVAVVVGLLLGVDVSSLLGGGANPAAQAPGASAPRSPEEDAQAKFVGAILADTEDTWQAIFKGRGQAYAEPKLVLFTDGVESACGFQGKAVGPFYCPADQKAYLDLSFFADLERRFKAPGDFARAYVVAHEIGHHVQNLLGTSTKVHQQRRALPPAEANALSVRMELQADCYSGIWAHFAHRERKLLDPGDLEEGLKAAAAIGDDTLQRQARGTVHPESWTHGSSEQRVRWFKRGFETGRLDACDTFGVAAP
ncbi:MAG: neutral zinc metallopeptidase [bacterium]